MGARSDSLRGYYAVDKQIQREAALQTDAHACEPFAGKRMHGIGQGSTSS